ncbi:ribonuclease-like protein H [Plenodomus tracheiphilus IPT5]|uniref:ribonuclease H n=1 Tax=Plenodomus tracheiphilus IPT5 TaxID=1408161 RepID=A0A6A7BGD7_9PLEO|nr:ribonuclease-like protein H [Plenodomus tracheiphilus IPT5]
MPFIMVFQVDGGCRNNGYYGAIAAAACVLLRRNGQPGLCWTEHLPDYPTPTNQRAELAAIILALKTALRRDEELNIRTTLDITIQSDSKYAINCMNVWMQKWVHNGWMNAAGRDVANRDLLEKATHLEDEIREQNGDITYQWIPRSENGDADRCCIDAMDDM